MYGGWESVEPWIEIRCHGHTLGHYLTAARLHVRVHGRRALRRARRLHRRGARGVPGEDRRLAHGVSRWRRAAHRQPRGQGLRRACPGTPRTRCWPGLRDAHLHRGSEAGARGAGEVRGLDRHAPARDVSEEQLPENARPRTRRHERGAAPTCSRSPANDTLPRAGAALLAPRAARSAGSRRRDALDGLHANTQIPKVIGFSRIAELDAARPHYDARRRVLLEQR